MSSTKYLEEFRDFIIQPIDHLIFNSKGEISVFYSQLLKKFDNVIGEARRNDKEYTKDREDSHQFFQDMIFKVSTTEELLFKKTNDGTIYKLWNYLIAEDGRLEGLYLREILTIIQKLKEKFASYHKPTLDSKRKTRIPSFTVPNASVLNDAYSQLTKFGYISDTTPKKDFIDIFTGRLVKNRINWLKDNNALAYFIRRIIERGAVLPLGKDHWLVTKKCFLIKGLEDYNTNVLRNSDPPEDPKILDIIINTF